LSKRQKNSAGIERMNLKSYISLSDSRKKRLKAVESGYRRLREDPAHSAPMFIVNVADKKPVPWKKRIEDPAEMLKGELDAILSHLEIEDDFIPTVRVQFGTPQVAAAFGAEILVLEDSLPAAKTHPLSKIEEVLKWKKPALDAGWFGKVKEYTDFYKANLPDGIVIQHPDIQGPFNTAHLVRGDDIFTDFYDNPAAVERLLDLVTDYMIDLVPHLKRMISQDREWFHDWGGFWQGTARISNCSMQMISPDFYMQYIFPRDKRLMEAIGGGRIHYCGRTREVLKRFLDLPGISAVDYDHRYHDLEELCSLAPENLVLFQGLDLKSETAKKLLSGQWPKKRNLLFAVTVDSVEEGREALKRLKASIPG
jgi:hypothetical protein